MSKFLSSFVVVLMLIGFTGCSGDSQTANVAEGATASDVEEYNRMLSESQAAYKETDEAMKGITKDGS